MIDKNILEFKEVIESSIKSPEPISINLRSKEDADLFFEYLKSKNIDFINTVKEQTSEYLEIYTRFYNKPKSSYEDYINSKKNQNTGITGKLIYFNWSKPTVFNILDEDMFYELITWRNKEKISEAEQKVISLKNIGIVGTSVGSFACRVLAKLGFTNFNIAEIKNMKPSNAPRMYQDSIKNYSKHKLTPLLEALYEFNPYIKINPFYNGLNTENLDDFFHFNNEKINILVDAADDGKIKILMRKYCKLHKIPLVTGFDEKGALLIERYDIPELLIEPQVTHSIEELERLKIKSPQEYVYKLLDFFPGGIDNISQRQKDTLDGINNNTRGGFSQLAWEASLFASYVSKSVLDIALGEKIHGVQLFDFDEMITDSMTKSTPYSDKNSK